MNLLEILFAILRHSHKLRQSAGTSGGWLGGMARGERATARSIEDTPRSKIATAPQGLVEVEGFAWYESEPDFTLANLEAVYTGLTLQREDTEYVDRKRKKVWRTVGGYSTGRPFYIVDDTGLALVDLAGVEFSMAGSRTTNWRKLTAEQQDRVKSRVGENISGFPPSTFLFGLFAKKFRVIENEILLGSPLYARGTFQTPDQSEHKISSPGLTGFCKRAFDLTGRSRKDVSRWADTNKDGKVSEVELRTFYTEAARAERIKARMPGVTVEEQSFGVYGLFASNENHRLMVADTHEQYLIKRLNRQWLKVAAVAAVVGGVIFFQIEKVRRDAEREYTPPPAKVVAPKRSTASVQSLHADCLAGQAKMCAELISRPNLPAANVEYYRSQACKLGLSEYCK